jgi:hypothetical protein
MQDGALGQLLVVLAAIPELHDDQTGLADMRGIFNVGPEGAAGACRLWTCCLCFNSRPGTSYIVLFDGLMAPGGRDGRVMMGRWASGRPAPRSSLVDEDKGPA